VAVDPIVDRPARRRITPVAPQGANNKKAAARHRALQWRTRMQFPPDLVDRLSAELRAVAESSSDAIFGETLDGVVTSWSRSAEQMLGFAADEMIGVPIARVIPDERVEEFDLDRKQVAAGKAVGPRDTVLRDRTGRLIDVSVTGSPVTADGGAVVGVARIVRDITRSTQAEKRMRLAVEAAPCAIILIDACGRIVFANVETERLFGWTRDELVGLGVETLVPERFRVPHAHLRGQYGEAPRQRPMGVALDLHARRKDGSEFPSVIGLNPVATPEGNYVIATVIDITARRQLQTELEQRAAELARSNRDLEEFARIASHDLQEPLRAVAGCVQILQRRYQSVLDERANELIAHTVDGASRMQKLIDDLLTYSRVGSKQAMLASVDCSEILSTALRNLSAAIEESGAIICHDALPCVRAVASEVLMLFQNTIGNAIKFRRPGVTPKIAVRSVPIEGRWCAFSVQDNGVGIAAQFHGKIFEVFQRLHTRSEYSGTGIGLALCKRIVENSGGRIWVESTLGEGSTFSFTLPRAD